MELTTTLTMSPALKRMLGDRFPSLVMARIYQATSSVMWKVLRHHQKKHMRPYAGARSGLGMLNIRSGDLMNSFRVRVRMNKSKRTVRGEYGTHKRRWPILERGGIIWGNPWLTVPLRDGLPTAANLRSMGQTFVRRSRSGKLLIWRRRGNMAPEPVYILKQSVKIEGRRTQDQTMSEIKKKGAEEITRAVRLLFTRGF